MGGAGSKRRVVVEDAGADGRVTVTEDVVRRLQGLPDRPTAATGTKQTQSDGSSATQPPSSLPAVPTDGTRLTRHEVEEFYLEKLKDLQERNTVLQQQTNAHFATAVKEVESKFVKFTTSPVCQDLQMKVMECYQSNAKDSLNCSGLVNAFTTCVDKARMVRGIR